MHYFSLLFSTLFFLSPISASASVPRGCKRLKSGRLSCRLKGRRKKPKNHIKTKVLWSWSKLKKFHRPLSLGSPWSGKLHRGKRISYKGAGYFIVPRTIRRGNVYGVADLISLIKRVAKRVVKKYPRSRMTVADLSSRTGGKTVGHRSHQSGRDVDFGFYLIDKRRRYRVAANSFIPINQVTVGKAPNGHLIFDLERNWELIEALVTDKVRVTQIFLSGHLKTLLLQYARVIQRPSKIIQRARIVIRPHVTHDDHFHVRIACPKNNPWCN
jgi:penicillin-insensitive murein DD-endopeptidase